MTEEEIRGNIAALEMLVVAVIRALPAEVQSAVKADYAQASEQAQVRLMNMPLADYYADALERNVQRLAAVL